VNALENVDVDPACLADPLCEWVFSVTGLPWLADAGYYVVLKPARIVLIVVGAIVLQAVVRLMLRRITRRAGRRTRRGIFHPWRERMAAAEPETAGGTRSERRRQRAEALGSVLRTVTSVTIFTVAAMMVLGELGVDLAPLIASAGIVGVALGFGAQNLVKDYFAGLFMLIEDQYGVGDSVDLGEVSGTVEEVGLRITTIRDVRGVIWYIRNGEIVRVGNRSQGLAVVVVDVPVGFAGVEEATDVLRAAAATLTEDPDFVADLLEAPQVLGVEQITIEGAVVRTIVKTAPSAQWRVARELRRRLTEALESAGIAAHLTANRQFFRPPGQTGELSAPTERELGRS
jgi:small conductance mechanosensitive channel